MAEEKKISIVQHFGEMFPKESPEELRKIISSCIGNTFKDVTLFTVEEEDGQFNLRWVEKTSKEWDNRLGSILLGRMLADLTKLFSQPTSR